MLMGNEGLEHLFIPLVSLSIAGFVATCPSRICFSCLKGVMGAPASLDIGGFTSNRQKGVEWLKVEKGL